MDIYNQLCRSSLDTQCIGVLIGPLVSSNVFTPVGAKVICWAENGIHFCQVDSLGDTVFCVDPAAAHGQQIHPVARNLTEFFRLILSSGGTQPISNAYRWSRSRFDSHICSASLSTKQQSALRALKNICHITQLDNPFQVIRSLQANFDYSALPLHADFDEHSSLRPGAFRWEVHYGESFCRIRKGEREGKRIPCGVSFQRGTALWTVPAIYDCPKGYVVDCCVQISTEAVKIFIEKWEPREHSLSTTDEQLLTLENPMELHCNPSLSVDGKMIRAEKSQRRVYIPWMDSPNDVRQTIMQYSLDEESVWVLYRIHFPKKGKKKNSPTHSLSLTIDSSEQIIPGIQLADPAVGDSFQLIHPGTAQLYTLTITEYSPEQLDPNFLTNPPSHYVQLCCTLSPDVSPGEFTMRDCTPDDMLQPLPGVDSILGQSDGPTSIFLSKPDIKGQHCFLSSFHYTPAKSITWQTEFHCKLLEPITISLPGGGK